MQAQQLIATYMKLRRRVMDSGAPMEHWTVSISPEDAEELDQEQRERTISGWIGTPAYIYGAKWVVDARIPRGVLSLTIRPRPFTCTAEVE